jgi:hypothetical protein
MPPPYYPGRRDLEQEAEDKRLKHISEREALDKAAVSTRADLLKHMGRIRPGQIAPPAWETYRNSPGVSGKSAMTDYILRYNAENPRRPFQPEVYTPQARPAAPAVAPAAAPSRVMANAPAVGVQASASNPQVRTGAPVDFPQQIKDPRTDLFGQTTNAIRNSVLNVPKAGASSLDAIPVQQSASGAQQPGPTSTTPRPPGIRDDGEVAIQKFLRNEIANMNPDNRPGAKVGWADDGRNGQKLVSVPSGERSGMAHLDALGEFQRKQQQDRADAYAGTLQRGQQPSAAGFAAWSKANPVNYDMQARAAQAHADAATAPRAVTSRAPVDYTGGAPAFARLGDPISERSGIYDNGKQVSGPRHALDPATGMRASATPTTDAANLAGAKTVVSPTNNAAAPLSTLDAAKAVAKENADEEQRKQAAITAEQDASNKGASNAAQAKALTPPGSIQRPKGELDGIPLEPLPNANPDGSMPKASEETIRAMTPQGLGQNVNDDSNSPYRLLAAAGSNPAAPMPSTSAVQTQGTGLSDDDIKRRKSGAYPFGGLVA